MCLLGHHPLNGRHQRRDQGGFFCSSFLLHLLTHNTHSLVQLYRNTHMAAVVIPAIAAVAARMNANVTSAQQWGQKVDKVNPMVTTQNVALGKVDYRLINREVGYRHGQTGPDFFAKPQLVLVKHQLREYAVPLDVDPSTNYNRAYVRAAKQMRMTPQHVQGETSSSAYLMNTDALARKYYKIDTSKWPY